MSGSKRIFWRVVFWLALAVFAISAGALAYFAYTYWKADADYADVASKAFPVSESSASAPLSLSDMMVDWDYLRSVNEDVVAWVYVPGTRINYPVVQGANNDKYLHTSFSQDGSFGGRGGAIFLDTLCAPDFSSGNSVMYGHHMNDGSMFAALSDDLTSQEGFNAARTVYVLTPARNFKCDLFALVRTTGSDLLAQADFATDADRVRYVQDKIDRSIVRPDGGFPSAEAVGQLFTLATCDYAQKDGRAIAFARVAETAVPGGRASGGAVDAGDASAVRSAASGE